MDIGPTVLELAGIEAPSFMEAKSLGPLLDGRSEKGRDLVFAELGPDNVLEKVRFMTMVRSRDWKLVHFLGSEDGQLFDLKEDPHEEANLWNSPSHASRKNSLIQEILHWRLESQIASRNWVAEYR
jgi:arylsulfatase A-like enzyme